jgi:hypothetical protein
MQGFARRYGHHSGEPRERLFVIDFTSAVPSGVYIATSKPTMEKSFSIDAELPMPASGAFERSKPREHPYVNRRLEFDLMGEQTTLFRCEATMQPLPRQSFVPLTMG